MTTLPEADPVTRAWFTDWLDRFSSHVRAVDYESARVSFHPDILAFGTHQDVLRSRESWISTQWDNVWRKTSDFRFNLDEAHILASDDASMAVVVAPWTSTGYHQDGSPFNRPGRATIVFHRHSGEWLGVHSHLSLNRGVPQASYGDRPVKAR